MGARRVGAAWILGLAGLAVVASLAVPDRPREERLEWLPVLPSEAPTPAEVPAAEPGSDRADPAAAILGPEPAAAPAGGPIDGEPPSGFRDGAEPRAAALGQQGTVTLRVVAALGGSLLAHVRHGDPTGLTEAPFGAVEEVRREGGAAVLQLGDDRHRRLEGWIVERAEGTSHLRGWLELPPGASEVSLSFPGRFVEVQLGGEGEVAELSIEAGPRPGWRPPEFRAGSLESGAAVRLWLPGAAAAVVATSPDGRRSRALVEGDGPLVLRLPARAQVQGP